MERCCQIVVQLMLIVGVSLNTCLAQKPIRHSIFIAGPTFTGILGEDGDEIWSAGKAGARDGCVLPNGNVLIAWSDDVRELTRANNKTGFHYRLSADNEEIGTAQRLENGNTLITELGKKPRLMEVDPTGKIAVSFELAPETDNGHMQTRMARKLTGGTYLVPHLLAFKVKEYDASGKILKEFRTDFEQLGGRAAENWPFTAIRLENGNTLVNLTHGNKTIEVDADGEIVWQVSNDDVEGKPFADPCGAQRLPNGNTVIASYAAKPDEGIVKIFELTREKKIVWSYSGKHRAHEIHVLTTNGQPIEGNPMR